MGIDDVSEREMSRVVHQTPSKVGLAIVRAQLGASIALLLR